jgi:hypothetical protein
MRGYSERIGGLYAYDLGTRRLWKQWSRRSARERAIAIERSVRESMLAVQTEIGQISLKHTPSTIPVGNMSPKASIWRSIWVHSIESCPGTYQ